MAWVYDPKTDKLVPKGSLPPKRNHFGTGPYVISDEMPRLQNMADGNFYTSKRQFEAETRAHDGCEIVGNEDVSKHTGKIAEPDFTPDIARAWSEHGGEA